MSYDAELQSLASKQEQRERALQPIAPPTLTKFGSQYHNNLQQRADSVQVSKQPDPKQQPPVSLSNCSDAGAQILPSVVTAVRQQGSLAIIMVALGMATFLAALDVAVVTTALPTIARYFHASQAIYSWVGSAYLLPYAALIPFWAKTSDIFGRKPALLTANVVFFLGSLVCALSTSPAMLIAGRAIQGSGGGGLIVLVNITIGDLVSQRERGKYLGLIGIVWATASSTGPVIGGALSQYASWRWCFWINLPYDGAAFFVLLFYLKVHNPRTKLWAGLKAIDWLGNLLILGAILMLLLGLQYGGVTYPWNSPLVLCLIVFGVFTFLLFTMVEWKLAKYPLLPLRLFKRRDTIALLGVVSMHGFSFVAAAYFLPYYFQEALGASPIESSVWFLPLALMLAALSMITGRLITRTGKYLELIIGGMGLATLGFGLFISFPAYKSWPRIILFQLIAALGLGPNFQAPLIAMQSKSSPPDLAVSTAAFSLTRNLSSAMSVILGGVILSNRLKAHTSQLVQAGIPLSTAHLITEGSAGYLSIIKTLNPTQRELVRKVVSESESDMWIFYTILLFIGFLCSFGIGKAVLAKTHEEHKTGLKTEEANRLANAQAKGEHEAT